MRSALLTAHGVGPTLGDREEVIPGDGESLIELRGAGLNPVDLAIGAGVFPGGGPKLPYVPGIEGVGTVLSSRRFAVGSRVFASGSGLGVAYDGTFAERFVAADESLVEVPSSVDDDVAAAFGVVGLAGWLPLAWRAPIRPDDRVLVLGATGNVGAIAVQAARLLGAEFVVAAGRDEKRLERAGERGADAIVSLNGDGLAERLAAAFTGGPPSLIVDLLWGEPLAAAATVAARGGRIVHIGQSAGPIAPLSSGAFRGKQLNLLGYSNFAVPADVLADGYRAVVEHAAGGRIKLDFEASPLSQVAEVWERQGRGDLDVKLILVP